MRSCALCASRLAALCSSTTPTNIGGCGDASDAAKPPDPASKAAAATSTRPTPQALLDTKILLRPAGDPRRLCPLEAARGACTRAGGDQFTREGRRDASPTQLSGCQTPWGGTRRSEEHTSE